MGGRPVNIMVSGGIAVTEVANGVPMTATNMPGVGVTIIASGGMPVTFVDESGLLSSPVQWSDGDGVEWSDGNPMEWSS